MKLQINGITVRLVKGWIGVPQREPGKHYYSVRHSDGNEQRPSTIENLVKVNFWGMAIADQPLKEMEEPLDYISIKDYRKGRKQNVPEEVPYITLHADIRS